MTPAAAPPHRQTFYGVQVLRGLAAIMVVLVHGTGNLSDFGYTLSTRMFFGNGGVDLFFLISGFVIVWTTQDEWWQPHAWRSFLDKRLTRVLPLYWILTTAKVLAVLALPFLFRNAHLMPWNTVASYLLIPSRDSAGNTNPIIDAGWTLCYEMAFYYVTTLCLFWRRQPLVYVTPVLVVLGLVGLLRQPAWGAAASLIDPLLLEFAAGMWLAELTRRGILRGRTWLAAGMVALGVAGLVASDLLPPETARSLRVLVWGVPSAFVLCGVLGLEGRVPFQRFRLLLLLGNASYSIYLAHVMVVPIMASRVARMDVPDYAQWAMVALLVVMGTAVGVGVWWLVERKLIRMLLRITRPVRAPVMARPFPPSDRAETGLVAGGNTQA